MSLFNNKYIFCLFVSLSIFCSYQSTLLADEDDDIFAEIEMEDKKKQEDIKNIDPFEKTNRKVFDFNYKIYDNFLLPITNFYDDKIPLAIRWTLKNYIQNYSNEPASIIYSVFDGDLEGIIVSFWRFTINTLFGFFGCDDVAALSNLQPYNKTIGNVLSFYKIPRGPFIMLPFFGPSNVRDSLGKVFELLMTNYFFMHYLIGDFAKIFAWQYSINPFYIPFHSNGDLQWIWLSWTSLSYMHQIYQMSSMANLSFQSSLDKYIGFRDNYLTSLEDEERRYKKLRFKGATTRTNICDYEGMIELPEECFEDPKEYGIGNPKIEEITFD